jgi:hypothetical protein
MSIGFRLGSIADVDILIDWSLFIVFFLVTLRALSQRGVNQLPVVKDGAVRGLIRREDILKWLSLHGEHAAAM